MRAILFDKDGTLLDYQKSWGPINRAAAALAARGDDALALRLLDLGGTDPASGITRADSLLAAGNTREIAEAWVAAGSSYNVPSLTLALDELFTRSAVNVVPVTDLGALFQRLKNRNLLLGIASSDSEAAIHVMLGHFGLDRYMSYVVGYDSGRGAKPGPGMLLGFAEATGISPAQIAVIGDNLHDMAMARAGGAGLRIAVLTGTGTRETLTAAADLCLSSIAELEEHLFPIPAEATRLAPFRTALR